MKIRGWILLAVAAVSVGGGAYAVTRTSEPDPELSDESRQVVVKKETLRVEIVDTGKIEPLDRVEVKSKVAGQVIEVAVEEGDVVEAGALLLSLEPTDYARDVARARSEVARAKNALDYASLDRDRKRAALEHRGVARIDVDLADNEVRARQIALERARIDLSAAQDRLRYTKIEAPIAGTVLEVGIDKGEVVTPGVQQTFEGRPLLTIGDLSALLVRAQLNQIDVARVAVGQAVQVSFDALPEAKFEATVTKVAPAATKPKGQDVEMFPVEARLASADPRVRPGMTADVRFQLSEHPDQLSVPIEAVVKAEDGTHHVFRIVKGAEGPEKEKVTVELGPRNDRAQAITQGLSEGDKVFISPPSAKDNEVEL